MLQYFVLSNSLYGDWMDNPEADFFDIDNRACPLQIGGNLECFKCHDVMHSLKGDEFGAARRDEMGGTPWWGGQAGGRTYWGNAGGEDVRGPFGELGAKVMGIV